MPEARPLLMAMALASLSSCESVQQRRLATNQEVLKSGQAIVIVSTSTEDRCLYSSYVAIKRVKHVLAEYQVNLNNAYAKSDFADSDGLFDAFVLQPGNYELILTAMGDRYYTDPVLARFHLDAGEVRYLGDVHAAGCGDPLLVVRDEWARLRPHLARRFPGIDLDRVEVMPVAKAGGPLGTSPAAGAPSLLQGTTATTPPPPQPAVEAPARQALWDIAFSLGFAVGGENLVTTALSDGSSQTLKAGTGLSLYLGIEHALLSSARHASFIGLEGGVKGWNIGGEHTDFDLQLVRFPLIPRLRYVYGDPSGVRLIAAAGLHYEIGVTLSGSGALDPLDADFDNALGWMGELGMMAGAGPLDLGLTARYTHLRYRGPELRDSVDGSNFGVTLLLQWSAGPD